MNKLASTALAALVTFGSLVPAAGTASADWKGPPPGAWSKGPPPGAWNKGPPPGAWNHGPPPGAWKKGPPPAKWGGYDGHGYKPKKNDGWNPGAAVAVGALFGLAIGAIANQPQYVPGYYPPPPPPPPAYPAYSAYPGYPAAAWNAHVAWCSERYRTYNPATNTFMGYDGFPHECVGP